GKVGRALDGINVYVGIAIQFRGRARVVGGKTEDQVAADAVLDAGGSRRGVGVVADNVGRIGAAAAEEGAHGVAGEAAGGRRGVRRARFLLRLQAHRTVGGERGANPGHACRITTAGPA